VKTTVFPKLELHGGPHGKDLRLTIDGQPASKAVRVELVGDVNDVVRAKITQIVEVVAIDIEASIEDKEQHRVILRLSRPGVSSELSATAFGGTLRGAVSAALDALGE
jgi:hypothetical protein